MISEREIVSSNQKTTGIFGFPNGCFAFAGDELSGKLVFPGARRVSIELSKSSSIHLSVKYLWLRVGNWAPLCLTIRMGATDSAEAHHHSIGNRSPLPDIAFRAMKQSPPVLFLIVKLQIIIFSVLVTWGHDHFMPLKNHAISISSRKYSEFAAAGCGFDKVRFEYVGRIPVLAKPMIAGAQKPF